MNNGRRISKSVAEFGVILLGLAILVLATVASGADVKKTNTGGHLEQSGQEGRPKEGEWTWQAPQLDADQARQPDLPGGGNDAGGSRGLPGGQGGSKWNDFGPPAGPGGSGLGWDRGAGWGGFGDPSGMPGGLDADGMIEAGMSPGNGPYGGINPMRNHGGADKFTDSLDGWKGLAEDRAGKTTGETQVAWETLGWAIENYRGGDKSGWQLTGITVTGHPTNPNGVMIKATMANGSYVLIYRDYGSGEGKDNGGVYVPESVKEGRSGFGDTGTKKEGEGSGSSGDQDKDKSDDKDKGKDNDKSDGKDNDKSDGKDKDTSSAKTEDTKSDDDKKSGGSAYTPDDGGSDNPNPKYSQKLIAARGAARAAAEEVTLPPNAHVVDPDGERNRDDGESDGLPGQVWMAESGATGAGNVGTTPYDEATGRSLSHQRVFAGQQVIDPKPDAEQANTGALTVVAVTGAASRMVAAEGGATNWQAIRAGEVLPAGTIVRTGLGSSVELAGLGGKTTLGSGTKIGIDHAAGNQPALSLVYGDVSIRHAGTSPVGMTVRTPSGARTLRAAKGAIRYNPATGMHLTGPSNAWAVAPEPTAPVGPSRRGDRTVRTLDRIESTRSDSRRIAGTTRRGGDAETSGGSNIARLTTGPETVRLVPGATRLAEVRTRTNQPTALRNTGTAPTIAPLQTRTPAVTLRTVGFRAGAGRR